MEIMELLKSRRTYRRFEQKPVEDNIVNDIRPPRRYASSAANRQPLSYIVVRSPEIVKQVFDCTRWAGYFPNDSGRPKSGRRTGDVHWHCRESQHQSQRGHRCRTGHQQYDAGSLESWRGKLYYWCLRQNKAFRAIPSDRRSEASYGRCLWVPGAYEPDRRCGRIMKSVIIWIRTETMWFRNAEPRTLCVSCKIT